MFFEMADTCFGSTRMRTNNCFPPDWNGEDPCVPATCTHTHRWPGDVSCFCRLRVTLNFFFL